MLHCNVKLQLEDCVRTVLLSDQSQFQSSQYIIKLWRLNFKIESLSTGHLRHFTQVCLLSLSSDQFCSIYIKFGRIFSYKFVFLEREMHLRFRVNIFRMLNSRLSIFLDQIRINEALIIQRKVVAKFLQIFFLVKFLELCKCFSVGNFCYNIVLKQLLNVRQHYFNCQNILNFRKILGI